MSGYIDQNGIEFNAIRFIHFKENTQDTVIIMFKDEAVRNSSNSKELVGEKAIAFMETAEAWTIVHGGFADVVPPEELSEAKKTLYKNAIKKRQPQ